MSILRVVLLAVLGACGTGSASSAKTPVVPLQILVVHSVDARCAAPCEDWIALDGVIDVGASARFARVLQKRGPHRPAILIHSPGGSVNDAIAIGRLIRSRHLDTAVGRSKIASCPADRDACRSLTPDGVVVGAPDTGSAFCASACSLVLAGGTRRFVGHSAAVGVHEFTSTRTLTKVYRLFRVVNREINGRKVEISRTLLSERPLSTTKISVPPSYTTASAYWADMGIDPDILRLHHLASSAQMYWLTPGNLRATRLSTDDADGQALVFRNAVASAARQPATPDDIAGPYENAKLTGEAGADGPLLGKVFWKSDQQKGPPGQDPVLLATVVFPDDAGRLVVRLQRATSVDTAGELHVSLALSPGGNGSPLQDIVGIGSPAIRERLRSTPIDLGGHVSAVDPLLMVLPAGAADADGPLASSEWVDLPLVTRNGLPKTVKIELGQSGAQALDRWRELDRSNQSHLPRS